MNTDNKQSNFDQLNRFQQSELIGRKALEEAFPNRNFQYTTGEYDTYDAFIDGDFKISLFEIKIRNASYDDYILESKKLNALIREAKKLYEQGYITVNIYYVNFTPSGTYVWDLSKAVKNLKKGSAFAGKTTAEASSKVNKSVYYLPVNRAYKIDYIINKEEIVEKLK